MRRIIHQDTPRFTSAQVIELSDKDLAMVHGGVGFPAPPAASNNNGSSRNITITGGPGGFGISGDSGSPGSPGISVISSGHNHSHSHHHSHNHHH